MTTNTSFFNKKNKTIKYVIITDTDCNKLAEKVQKHLKDGYELQGGVSTAHSPRENSQIIYSQALTIKE